MNNDIWLLAALILLLTTFSEGARDIRVSIKDDKFLQTMPPNVRPPPLDSRTKRVAAEDSQSPNLSLKSKITSDNEHTIVTPPWTEVSSVVELYKTGTSWSIQSPPLSMKATSTTDSGDFILSNGKDDPELRHFVRKTFSRRHCDAEKKTSNADAEMSRDISWHGKSPMKYYYRGKIRRQLETLQQVKTESNHTARLHHRRSETSAHASAVPVRMTKRELPTSEEAAEDPDILAVIVEDESGRNIIKDNNQNCTTTEVMHPVTQEPQEEEEFVPGMSKLRFVTVTSTSLAMLCVAMVILYYFRRRRLRRLMDPERQNLIPFRMSTGVYYNQTGPCF